MTEAEGKKLDELVEDYKTGQIHFNIFVLKLWNLAYKTGQKDLREAIMNDPEIDIYTKPKKYGE